MVTLEQGNLFSIVVTILFITYFMKFLGMPSRRASSALTEVDLLAANILGFRTLTIYRIQDMNIAIGQQVLSIRC